PGNRLLGRVWFGALFREWQHHATAERRILFRKRLLTFVKRAGIGDLGGRKMLQFRQGSEGVDDSGVFPSIAIDSRKHEQANHWGMDKSELLELRAHDVGDIDEHATARAAAQAGYHEDAWPVAADAEARLSISGG